MKDITDEIREVYDLLRSHGPVLQEVWFVDAEREYYQFIEMLEEVGTAPSYGYLGSLVGVPVVRWERRHHDPDKEMIAYPPWVPAPRRSTGDKLVRPWFCWIPGVWLKMSDGEHRRIVFEQ